MDAQELELAKKFVAKGYILIKGNPSIPGGVNGYSVCKGDLQHIYFSELSWADAVKLLEGLPPLKPAPPRKTLFVETKVVDVSAIPDQAMVEAALFAQTECPSRYMSWTTSWRNSEGGNDICSNSEEHTALSHYLMEYGCGPDEWVILETSFN